MKKALFACLFLSGCYVAKPIAIKGDYPSTPIQTTTPTPFDKVWSHVIDFFAQNGIPIKIIDKSSGLIVTEAQRIPWSYEDDRGIILHKDAYVVLEKMIYRYKRPLSAFNVTGEWNIRVKEDVPGNVVININLVNVTYQMIDFHRGTVMANTPPQVITNDRFKSTGNFENSVFALVK